MPVLQGKSTQLRAPEPEDLEYLYQWENDPEIWQVSNTIAPFSRYTLRNYLETAHQDIYQVKQLRLMIDTQEYPVKTIGTIDLFDFDPFHNRAGIGILIGDKSARNKGLAGDALDTLIDYSFSILKLHQLYCNIGASNQASIQLFEKKGFKRAGEKRDWNFTNQGWETELFYQLIHS